jgi:hypothetical protein
MNYADSMMKRGFRQEISVFPKSFGGCKKSLLPETRRPGGGYTQKPLKIEWGILVAGAATSMKLILYAAHNIQFIC